MDIKSTDSFLIKLSQGWVQQEDILMNMLIGTLLNNFMLSNTAMGTLALNKCKSAFEEYLTFRNLDLNNSIPLDLFRGEELSNFVRHLESKGVPLTTGHKQKSRLKLIAYYMVENQNEGYCISFDLKLAYHLDKEPLERSKIALELGMSASTLGKWRLGQQLPSLKNKNQVLALEKYLKLEEGALLNSLGKTLFGEKTSKIEAKVTTEYGHKMSELVSKPYSLPFKNWPLEASREFQLLLDFYLVEEIEDHPSLGDFYRHSSQRWGTVQNPTGSCKKAMRLFESFFGYLISLNHEIEKLSIGLISNPQLIKGFVKFRKERMGAYTTGIHSDLKLIKSFLISDRGYIYQQIELERPYLIFSGSFDPSSDGVWKKNCEEGFKICKSIIEKNKFKPVRNTSSSIRDFLDIHHGYGHIKDFLNNLKTASEQVALPPVEKAKRVRNYLLAKFHFMFGHRAEVFSKLTVENHFLRLKDGRYIFKIYKLELKDGSLMVDDYVDIQLPMDVSREIDNYLINHRRHLEDAENSKYFFLACKNSTGDRMDHIEPDHISRIIKNESICYTSSLTGFGSHAVRSIISSLINCSKLIDNYLAGSTIVLNSPRVNKTHYTYNIIQAAFVGHFKKLQCEGILAEDLTLKEVKNNLEKTTNLLCSFETLQKENEQLKIENEVYKKMLPNR